MDWPVRPGLTLASLLCVPRVQQETPPAAGPDPEKPEQGHQELYVPSLTMASLLSVLRVTTAGPTCSPPRS